MNFETHMGELAPAEAAAFRSVARALRAVPEREPTASLEGRILAAVEGERGRARRRRPWQWGLAAAAGLAAALTLFDLSMRGRAPASPADGIRWLAESQSPDGTWDPAKHGGLESYRPALTALSALALDRSGGYADQVGKACRALAALQSPDGAFGGSGRVQLYNHAITTYALATLCPKHLALRPTLDRALVYVAARQTVQGGWDYEPRSEGNAALTAWQVRALSCAEQQGFEAAKVPLRKGLRWLRSVARDDGSIAYHRDSATRSEGLTALAAYALITAGKPFPGLPELGRRVVGSLHAEAGQETVDCYRDYARVLAFESAGALPQAAAARDQLQRHQQGGGCDQWETTGGRLYTTAFAALAAK